jgi:AraC-like DNA-binding protein
MECKLDFLYYVKRSQSEYISPHKHECFELVYYINGTGITKMEDKVYFYSPNTFAVVRPDCSHDETHDVDTEVLFIGFHFSGTDISLNNGIYMDDHHRSVLNYLEEIKKEMAEQKKFFRLKLDLLLKELLIELERIRPYTVKKISNLSYIKKFMKENCNQQIDLKVLADLSGYSYHRFRHIFKEKTGISPLNYIINYRVFHAKKLLLQNNLSILEISQACGFYSQSQFSAMFKRNVGITPSMYRKRLTAK